LRPIISESPDEWSPPPDHLHLGKGEVHVWRGIVDIPSAALQVFKDMLSGEERDRAARFRFPRHQHRFIAARGMLRSLLGRYVHLPPRDIEFGFGAQGKPFLKNRISSPLYFNISHSQKIALFAFSSESEVGIDVEGPQPRLDYQGVAQRVLSSQEQQWLQDLPAFGQKSALLTAWARKEAFVKAMGTGLTFPLRDITITILPDQPPRLVHITDPSLNGTHWSIHPLNPRVRYVAALVVAGHPHQIRLWNYPQRDFGTKPNKGTSLP